MFYNPLTSHIIKVPDKYGDYSYAIRKFNIFKFRWEYYFYKFDSQWVIYSNLEFAIRDLKESKSWKLFNFKKLFSFFDSSNIVNIPKERVKIQKEKQQYEKERLTQIIAKKRNKDNNNGEKIDSSFFWTFLIAIFIFLLFSGASLYALTMIIN
jgi:ATP-dependent Zn protease